MIVKETGQIATTGAIVVAVSWHRFAIYFMMAPQIP